MLVEGELQGAETDAFGQFILGLGQVALDLDALQTVRQSPRPYGIPQTYAPSG